MVNLVELPEIVLEKVFSFLPFDTVSQNRTVCKRFNYLGGVVLNKGYYTAEKFHGKTLKSIKAKLPRRESERRMHPLSRQCDILIAIETRLSMLSMTYTKWMDAKLCCFIPGKVIDEIMKVLRCVSLNPNPPRTHEILQELRDISSMAMEHFDEKILPQLRLNMSSRLSFQSVRTLEDLDPTHKCLTLEKKFVSIVDFNKLLVREFINRRKIKAQAAEIAELRQHIEEWESKLNDISANLTKATEAPSTSSIVLTRASKRKKEEEGASEKCVKKVKKGNEGLKSV